MKTRKVVRICWNTKQWERPSGPYGKSKSLKAYESQTGYGHEEWIFDLNKVIDGYHYGYLQAIGGHRDKYIGETFDISFYSINSATSERWWIGRIDAVIVVDGKESANVLSTYKRNGWYDEMLFQLAGAGAKVGDFRKVPANCFDTIKFKPTDVHLLNPPLRILLGDPAVSSDYYNLKNWIQEPSLEKPSGKFDFRSGHNPKKDPKKRNYRSQSISSDPIHNIVQDKCYSALSKKFGKENVATEQDDGMGNRIDIVVRTPIKRTHWFYEIKTYNTGSACLREGISQLMEYAYYSDPKAKNVEKLVVISPNILDKSEEDYLIRLRTMFHLPIFYQRFLLETNCIDARMQ
jgi:hypothetical protein